MINQNVVLKKININDTLPLYILSLIFGNLD